MTFLCGCMGFLTVWGLLPSPNHLKRSRVKLCCLLSPSLGSHIELMSPPRFKEQERRLRFPMGGLSKPRCKKRMWNGGCHVWNPQSTIQKHRQILSGRAFFQLRFQSFSPDKVSKNSSTRITKYIKFIKKEGILRKSQQK